jgi:hypothetical protein
VTFTLVGRDGDQVDAMLTDRYLDALLSAHAVGAERIPASTRLDPGARHAADRLSRELPRFHPSFRFEEGLWLRLAEVAHGMRPGAAADPDQATITTLAALAALVDGPDQDHDATVAVRPLLVGGALTSAALSLAGAAYVAWRLSRPSAAPMARAVRAVGRTRLT